MVSFISDKMGVKTLFFVRFKGLSDISICLICTDLSQVFGAVDILMYWRAITTSGSLFLAFNVYHFIQAGERSFI